MPDGTHIFCGRVLEKPEAHVFLPAAQEDPREQYDDRGEERRGERETRPVSTEPPSFSEFGGIRSQGSSNTKTQFD